MLADCARRFKAPVAELPVKIDDVIASLKAVEKTLEQMKSQMASKLGDTLVDSTKDVNGVKLLTARMDGADAKALRETMDKVKDKLGSALVVLASVTDGRVQLAAGVTRDLTAKVKAGDLVNHVAAQVGGKGGGKPDMAMAGGTDATHLDAALASVEAWAAERL